MIQFLLGPHQLAVRTTEDISSHYRGYTGEFEFRVPRGLSSPMAQHVIQNDQANQMHSHTGSGTSMPIGNRFKVKINMMSLGITLKFANLTHVSEIKQVGYAGLYYDLYPICISGYIAISVIPALTDRVTIPIKRPCETISQ